jgi:hypothetical protein
MLTQGQKNDIRDAFLKHDFSLEAETAKLVARGYDEAQAKKMIVAELREYKKALFQKVVKRQDNEEAKNVITIGIMMVALIGPVFNIESPLWYITAVVLAGVGGYFGFKQKPIAGVLGAIIVPIVFPFTYAAYFSDRTHFIKIEMLIPLVMAIVPAFIVYFIISKTVYANRTED